MVGPEDAAGEHTQAAEVARWPAVCSRGRLLRGSGGDWPGGCGGERQEDAQSKRVGVQPRRTVGIEGRRAEPKADSGGLDVAKRKAEVGAGAIATSEGFPAALED